MSSTTKPQDPAVPAETNAHGQPLGPVVHGWKRPAVPPPVAQQGMYCRLEPLNAARHAADLFEANSVDREGRMWTYLPEGPFADFATYREWLVRACQRPDLQLHAIVDVTSQKAVGAGAYLRIQPDAGSIEVGYLMYSPLLKRTTAATEAMYLLMSQAFSLGYRRYEWKCNALNAPSRVAALRLGFVFEGIFRQAQISRGRNRDTAWYSIIDRDWPALQAILQRWLDPANFDAAGRQRVSLSALTSAADFGCP